MKAERELKKANIRREQAEAELARARETLARHQAGQEAHQQNQQEKLKLEQARQVYVSLDGLQEQLRMARKRAAEAEKTLQQRSLDLQEKDQQLAQAFETQNRAGEEYDRAQLSYRRGIGGILAETLEAGKPCPVCGSVTHPAPAEKEPDHVTEAELDRLNKAFARCGKQVSAAMKARTLAESARNEAQQVHNEALRQQNMTEHSLRQAETQLIPGIDTAGALERAIRDLDEKISRFEALGQKLLRQQTDAQAESTAAALTAEQWGKNLAAASESYSAQAVIWQGALAASGFGREDAFLAATMEPEKKQQGYRALNQWQADLQAAKEALEEQRAALAGKNAPDLAALKAARDTAEMESRTLTEKRILQGKTLKDMKADEKKLTYRLESCREALVKLEADQVFARRIAGSHGVGLQRYVLGVMMNSITAQANRLLENVYGGRYRLHRTDETTGRTLKGGLELEVFDSHNSQRRSVRTLSGGEKFLVALSLAIGLSTVVQAQGEGIRLEAMFIDEGFGSLDREAIQDALEILQGIRRSAGIVGIISHVETLAESIPAQLQITKGKRGSHVRLMGV